MQAIVDKDFNYDKEQEQRVFWGTFGDTDIRKTTIRDMYYDEKTQYDELQELKERVDPEDIFHTDLTVKRKVID